MKKILAFFARPAVYLATLGVFLAFGFIVLPSKAADSKVYTPQGASFDTSFFYTPMQAAERAAAYSDEGRAASIFDRWTFDLAFPAVYGLFLVSSWAFWLTRLFPEANRIHARLLLIPVLGIVFDLAENTWVTVLMLAYPAAPMAAMVGASASTLLKWLFVGVAFAGAVLLPAATAIAAAFRKRR